MNDPKSQQEPSMEEILASIRRIISEDDAETDEASDAAPEDAEAASPAGSEAEPQDAAEPGQAGDDVLDLTEVVDEESSLDPESDGYDMELTDDSDLVEVVESVEEPEPEPIEVAAAPEPAPAAPPPSDDGLISPPPASEATSQFSALAAAVAGDRLGQAMGVGARTIEDLVKEVMRPMIKEWLDAHLPELVERLVGREIDRMSRRAEDNVDD